MFRDTRQTFGATPWSIHRSWTQLSPTSTVPSASATRATAMPRPCTCRRLANIPANYATEGTCTTSSRERRPPLMVGKWGPGFATFHTPITTARRRFGTTIHALGMTRLNVYAGPAGFFIIRGGPSGDGAVLDSRTGTPAVLPAPAPAVGDPAGLDVLRDPDRGPGLRVQRRWFTVLSGCARVLRRDRRSLPPGRYGLLAGLEPRVLRELPHCPTGIPGRSTTCSSAATASASSTAASRAS